MAHQEPAEIPVYRVTIEGEPHPHSFDNLDVATAFIRGYVGTNGTVRANVETVSMSRLRYSAEVEQEEAA